jgi:phage terminase large subunit GpA-like protein
MNNAAGAFLLSSELVKAPSRITVSQSAAQHLYLPSGTQAKPYNLSETPYMRLPMDMLSSKKHSGVVFAGSAQSGKTAALTMGWLAHNVVSDPSDYAIVQMTKDEARIMSRQRVARAIEASPELAKRIGRSSDDNVFDKRFTNGVFLNFLWPTISNLSSKPIPRIALTDYDRMPESIDGEGNAYTLAQQRTKSFGSLGKTLAESTPGFEVIGDTPYTRKHHEPPPVKGGVLSLYDSSDRHRWYWKCPHCKDEFLAEWENLWWDKEITDPMRAGQTAAMLCPHCGAHIESKQKYELNIKGRWLTEDQIYGTGLTSDIAGFWMHGTAAAYQSWAKMVTRYLQALQEYEKTGSQESLKSTINTDQGRPYQPISRKQGALDAVLLQQKSVAAKKKIAPAQTRFLTAAVDVQNSRFVVQVQAWGDEGKTWIVDRFNFDRSARLSADGMPLPIQPFVFAEDWRVLNKLLSASYEVEGGGTLIKIRLITCDSGGAEHGTVNAYSYYKALKKQGLHNRFRLLKGGSRRGAAKIAIGKPSIEHPQVDFVVINTNIFKDEIADFLKRDDGGANSIFLPEWFTEAQYKEITSEVRTATGWVKAKSGARNETLDLLVYNRLAFTLLGGDNIDWSKPPPWFYKPTQTEQVEKPVKKIDQAAMREKFKMLM